MPWTDNPLVAARWKALRGRLALPGWLLLGLGAIRSTLSAWNELDFVWDKLSKYSWFTFLVSPTGLLLAGLVWLTILLLRPATVSSTADQREEKVAALLQEAAAWFDEHADDATTLDDAGDHMLNHLRVIRLIEHAFLAPTAVTRELNEWLNDEREKHQDANVKFRGYRQIGIFLHRLATSLRNYPLDPGFHLPQSFAQFQTTDKWSPNTRPLPQ